MATGRIANIEFDKFYNVIDGKQRGADKFRNGVNPATKENLWEVGDLSMTGSVLSYFSS
jgi:hypothetical protein